MSGSEAVLSETDLDIEVRPAETIERLGAFIAAVMVRLAVAYEWAAPAKRAAVRPPGGGGVTEFDSEADAAVSHEKAAAYRRAAAQVSVRTQVERLDADLEAHLRLVEVDDPRARGAALAAAHAVLVLASRTFAAEADRQLRRATLDTALPVLVRAGLGHLAELVQAALTHDGDPALQARGVVRLQ